MSEKENSKNVRFNKKSSDIRKPYVNTHVTEKSLNDMSMPVDYSFKNYKQIEETRPAKARRSRFGNIRRGNHDKFLSSSLWLNHNSIMNTRNIENMVESLFEYPERLAFLDLSHNQIKEIDSSVLKCTNLKVLYLHDNKICDVKEIYKLRQLKRLHNLTLFGNPLYDLTRLGNHRTVVKYLLPQISKLDYCTLSGVETNMPVSALVVRFLAEKEGRILPYIPNKIKGLDELCMSNKSKESQITKSNNGEENICSDYCSIEATCCSSDC